MFERIQIVKDVRGDNNLVINGDLICNEQTLGSFAKVLLEKEIDRLTTEAKQAMRESMYECVQRITEKMVENHLQEIIKDFSTPAVQYAYYTTLKGYSMSETYEQREFIVDAFIDRIQKGWNSTEKMILNEVLEIMPSLTPQTLAFLGLFQLRHQANPLALVLNQYFNDLTKLVEQVDSVHDIDIEYLKQKRILLPVVGIKHIASLEETLLSQYDLFFRHTISACEYEDYCNKNPEARHAVNLIGPSVCMMYALDETRENLNFISANSSHLKNKLLESNLDFMISHVDNLMHRMPAFTKEELRNYFIKLSPNWERVFQLFESESFNTYYLSIVGFYIGGKILAKVCHRKDMLSISDYKKTIV